LTATRGLRLAAVQMRSTNEPGNNLDRACKRVREAADRGADVVALPENFAFMGSDEERARVAQDLDGEILTTLAELAREKAVNILGGSVLVKSSDDSDSRPTNTSVFFDRAGNRAAVYNKIHLFDVSLTDGALYRESSYIRPGAAIVTACREGTTFGLTICYDLRFPELYRALARRGAQVVFVPAAFTVVTGKEHWMPLLRARAIESQVYVVAPAQFGRHDAKRETHGHSAIVDPWGAVLAQAPERECVIYADFDAEYLQEVRRRIPVLDHERPEIFSGDFTS
jgi:predicted amidohydrolase